MSREAKTRALSHAAKTRALMAYDVGALSDAGTARLEAHLAGCDVCRRELAAMRAYARVVEEARKSEPAAHDWSRMELALRREAKKQARFAELSSLAPTGALVALAATALLAIAFGWPEEEEVAVIEPPGAVDETELPAVVGTVTLAAGCVRSGPGPCLAVGQEVAEGARLAGDVGTLLHVRLSAGTGFVLGAETRLATRRIRGGDTVLELASGEVSSQVSPLGDAGRYEVHAGRWMVRVHGTRFKVSHLGEELAVAVDEGTVQVFRDGALVETLVAPARFRSDGGAADASAVPIPVGLETVADSWPLLQLPALDGLQWWQIAGAEHHTAGALSMRVQPGPLRLLAHTTHGIFAANVDVGEGMTLTERELRLFTSEETPQASLPREAIRQVVQRGSPAMQFCYQAETRRNLNYVGGNVTARITVGGGGTVTRVELRGDISDRFRDCLQNQIQRWVFPAPGATVPVSVPLNFRPRRTAGNVENP